MDWDQIRANRFAVESPPADWPSGVRPISIKGLALIGVHPAINQLYWDGQALVTERRLATFERVLASAATGSALLVALVEVLRAFGLTAG